MIEYETHYKYKDMCNALDIPVLRGSYLKTQMAQLSELYDIEKTEDNKYIIHKEYNELEQIEHKRQGREKAYLTLMIYTMLDSADDNDNIIRCTMSQMLELLSVVNKDYNFAKWNYNKVDRYILNGDRGGLEYFVREIDSKYSKVVKEILYEMADQKLIDINLILMFARRYRTDKGDIRTKTWEANKNTEIPLFLEAQREVVKLYSLNTWSEFNQLPLYVRNSGKEDIIDIINKNEDINISYFYYEYEIILNKKGIQEMILNNPIETNISFNKLVQSKIYTSKAKDLLIINKDDKNAYIDTLIDITNDYKLRDNLK